MSIATWRHKLKRLVVVLDALVEGGSALLRPVDANARNALLNDTSPVDNIDEWS